MKIFADTEDRLAQKVIHLHHQEENTPDLADAIMLKVSQAPLPKPAVQRNLRLAGVMATISFAASVTLLALVPWWGPWLNESLVLWVNTDLLETLAPIGFLIISIGIFLTFEPLIAHFFRKNSPIR